MIYATVKFEAPIEFARVWNRAKRSLRAIKNYTHNEVVASRTIIFHDLMLSLHIVNGDNKAQAPWVEAILYEITTTDKKIIRELHQFKTDFSKTFQYFRVTSDDSIHYTFKMDWKK